MSLLAYLNCSDPHVGRVDKSVLLQQVLMEMVISEIKNCERICGSREEPNDVIEWAGVTVDMETQLITEIHWICMQLQGAIDAQWIPASVVKINAINNSLDDTLDFASFPPTIMELWMNFNRFSGSLELQKFPESLCRLAARLNSFAGSVCFTELPAGLAYIDLSETQLSGSLDLIRPRRH